MTSIRLSELVQQQEDELVRANMAIAEAKRILFSLEGLPKVREALKALGVKYDETTDTRPRPNLPAPQPKEGE